MIQETLQTVRRRLKLVMILKGIGAGLLVGAASALAYAGIRFGFATELPWQAAPGMLVAGGVVGLLISLCRPAATELAAKVVDETYALKDSSLTALQFAAEPNSDPLRRLQVQQAEAQLSRVDAKQCVPVTVPQRSLTWSAGLSAAAALVLLVTNWSIPEVQAATVLPMAEIQAMQLRKGTLAELEKLALEVEDPVIDELLKELKEKVDELETKALDEADLMATLSEMETAIAEAREAMKIPETDAMLKALAEAIKPSEAMQMAAGALEEEDYDKAAEELKNLDLKDLSDKERRAVADNLKKMVAKLSKGQKGELSEAIGELAEGLKSKSSGECKKSVAKICKACKKQGQKKKAGKCMACELNRLAECKCECRGTCESEKVAKSNSPSQKAGKGSASDIFGKKTELDGSRREEQLTGQHSDGPSETEITQAPEGEQQAARQFAAKYKKFQKEAEAVLNSEPLPMGHRETVRKYFESIRPNNEEANAAASEKQE